MIQYLFWILLLFLLIFITYHLIPALHIYVTDKNLKFIRRYKGFMDDDMFHIPPNIKELGELLPCDKEGAFKTAQWGNVWKDGPCKSMPHNCYWYDSMLYCKSHLL